MTTLKCWVDTETTQSKIRLDSGLTPWRSQMPTACTWELKPFLDISTSLLPRTQTN